MSTGKCLGLEQNNNGDYEPIKALIVICFCFCFVTLFQQQKHSLPMKGEVGLVLRLDQNNNGD